MEDIVQFEITEKNTAKAEKIFIGIPKDVEPYAKLIKVSLFHEAFLLLEKNVAKIEDDISKSIHLKGFFDLIFNLEIFNKIIEDNNLIAYSKVFIKNLNENIAFKSISNRLEQFINSEITNVMLATLIRAGELEEAKQIAKFCDVNLANYPNTLFHIVENNDVEALRFICENMKNIHFNEGALLRLTSEMSPEAMKMLIEEYNFNINDQSRETSSNFVVCLVKDQEMGNFKYLLQNYGNKIDWNLIYQNSYGSQENIFNVINQQSKKIDFYSIILDDLTLRKELVKNIADSLFADKATISDALKTDVFEKLFSHPSFDHKLVNLGQNYFIYGLFSKVGNQLVNKDFKAARDYNKVLKIYLDNIKNKEIPEATHYHALGAAISLRNNSYFNSNKLNKEDMLKLEKVLVETTEIVAKHYPELVNTKNPNGKYPILTVNIASPLHDALLKYGAAPIKSEFTIWGFIQRLFGFYSPKVDEEKVAEFFAKLEANKSSDTADTLENKLEKDFIEIEKLIHNPLCENTIKYKYENIYLKAKHLVSMIEKHNIEGAYEEKHFLTENLAKYVKRSLQIYLNITEATLDFVTKDQQASKLQVAKDQCVEQLDLLKDHLDTINQNIFHNVEDSARTTARVHSRILKEKFDSITKTLSIDEYSEADKIVSIKSGVKESEAAKNMSTLEKKKVELDIFKSNIQNVSKKVENIEEEVELENEAELDIHGKTIRVLKI